MSFWAARVVPSEPISLGEGAWGLQKIVTIVDDDESVREATKGFVRSLGYSAAAFSSLEEFPNSDRLKDTSCLIADVQMSGLSGMERSEWLSGRNDDGERRNVDAWWPESSEGQSFAVLYDG